MVDGVRDSPAAAENPDANHPTTSASAAALIRGLVPPLACFLFMQAGLVLSTPLFQCKVRGVEGKRYRRILYLP